MKTRWEKKARHIHINPQTYTHTHTTNKTTNKHTPHSCIWYVHAHLPHDAPTFYPRTHTCARSGVFLPLNGRLGPQTNTPAQSTHSRSCAATAEYASDRHVRRDKLYFYRACTRLQRAIAKRADDRQRLPIHILFGSKRLPASKFENAHIPVSQDFLLIIVKIDRQALGFGTSGCIE